MTEVSASASDECNILSPTLCRVVNADAYSLLLAFWASLQLTWVSMLLFVQFLQVSRAMTTYENMFGIDSHHSAASLTSAFTSTGAPLDPSHLPPSGSAARPDGHGHGHKHGHGHGGWLKQWGRLLGVDAFIATATDSNKGGKKKNKGNPYSKGCLTNCKDFWCDPAPMFGKRENGSAVLGGVPVNYTDMYESPSVMEAITRGRGTTRGNARYEAVAGDDAV